MTLRHYIQISQRKGKKKGLLDMWVFSAKIEVSHTTYTLESYSHFKSNVSFNSESILEIHDNFKTRGNVCFNDFSVSQLIKTLSNQDFAGFDNFNKLENLYSACRGLQGS